MRAHPHDVQPKILFQRAGVVGAWTCVQQKARELTLERVVGNAAKLLYLTPRKEKKAKKDKRGQSRPETGDMLHWFLYRRTVPKLSSATPEGGDRCSLRNPHDKMKNEFSAVRLSGEVSP